MSICARPCCLKDGLSRCSICLRELYCSGDCQKGDWKLHKSVCKILKKMSLQLQPYHEVVRVFEETIEVISTQKKQQGTRVLQHLITYVEHQFSDRVLGKAYRERGNGERIDNWKVEIEILISVYFNLLGIYQSDELLSLMVRDDLSFPYYKKMVELLKPWSAYLDLNCSSQVSSLSKKQINRILLIVSHIDGSMGEIYTHRSEFVLAEDHCRRALYHAKLFEGKEEHKTDLLCDALRGLYEVLRDQGNLDEALTLVEEAYNCVAIAYDPVHPKVQEVASTLIDCLSFKGDFDQAETFAQMTLDSLKDPGNGLDQQSEEVAKGYYNLGEVINQQKGDYAKAELLVRESLRIRSRLYNSDHRLIGMSIGLLARALQLQGKLGSETNELYERALFIEIKNFGPEGLNTAVMNFNLGNFYHQQAEETPPAERRKDRLLLSESSFKEALRVYTKIYGPDQPETIKTSYYLSIVSQKLSEA